MGLVLGDVAFADFELPSSVEFGGRQGLAVHRLPGGARVVDVTGRDDAAIGWSGVLAGANAADRARLLDAMRAGGAVYALRWNAFIYAVVIAELTLSYRGAWWIPYRIRCCVVQDEAQSDSVIVPAALAVIEGDLASAASLLPIGDLSGTVGESGGLQAGTFEHAAAVAAVQAASAAVASTLAAGEAGLGGADLARVVTSSGQIAAAVAAQGFLGRVLTNLGNTGS